MMDLACIEHQLRCLQFIAFWISSDYSDFIVIANISNATINKYGYSLTVTLSNTSVQCKVICIVSIDHYINVTKLLLDLYI